MLRTVVRGMLSVTLVSLLVACGGGSGSSDDSGNTDATPTTTPTESVNNAPTVNAGEDKSVTINETIILTGLSNDSDGSIVAYEWKEGSKFLGNTPTLEYLPTVAGTYTLTLTVTDNDGATASDSVVVTVKNISESYYKTCKEIQLSENQTSDGDYIIDPDGEGDNEPFEIYCHDMSTVEPKEFLNLVNVGENYNYSLYKSGGARTGEDVITHYTKIRIDLETLIVDRSDATFSSTTGKLYYNGNPAETYAYYGKAWDCIAYNSSEGRANIDLTGTPFKIDDKVLFDPQSSHSWYGDGTTSIEQNRQVVNTTGGGILW